MNNSTSVDSCTLHCMCSQSVSRYSAFQPVTAPISTSTEQQIAVHLEGSAIPCLDAPNPTPSTGLDSSASVPLVPVPIRRRRLVQRPGACRGEGASTVVRAKMSPSLMCSNLD